jgi:hypothetical protein
VRDALHAPQDAVFANEIITADSGGDRKTRWLDMPNPRRRSSIRANAPGTMP